MKSHAIHSGDERLTAYALGELNLEGQREVELALEKNPALRAEVQAIREFSVTLRQELQQEPIPKLLPEQRYKVESSAEPLVDSDDHRYFWWRLLLTGAPALAAVLLVVGYIVFPGAPFRLAKLVPERIARILVKTRPLTSGPAASEIQVTGSLTAAVIQSVIDEHLVEIRRCYNEAHRLRPELNGKLTLSLHVEADGSVTSSQIEESTAPGLDRCLLQLVRSWNFPKGTHSEPTEVHLPFSINPDA